MRNIYHISLSSHDEVMFRSEADINYAFNCFALSCLETESRPLADSEMTTHNHFAAATDSPSQLVSLYRYKYSRYFNNKYGRKGRLGERYPFILGVDGIHHTQTMLSYVFRQGLHHGLASTPFGYKHNSVNAIFGNELGKSATVEIAQRNKWAKFLPGDGQDIPDGYRMSKDGLLLREDVIDVKYVEEVFLTPRNFLYQMNRLTSDQWIEEQNEDNNGLPPITLSDIEPPKMQYNMAQLLQNENGRNVKGRITDLELCELIDTEYVADCRKESVYDLSDKQRAGLGNRIFKEIREGLVSRKINHDAGIPDVQQIRRCAVIK